MIKQYIKRLKFQKLLGDLTITNIDTLSGNEFEVFVRDLFEYLGYRTTLTRSTGDNGVDIIARSPHYSIGIQTKLYYNHSVGNKAIQEVYSGTKYYKLDYAIVVSNWTFSSPAQALAKELKVGLIDRTILNHILQNDRHKNIQLLNHLLYEIRSEL